MRVPFLSMSLPKGPGTTCNVGNLSLFEPRMNKILWIFREWFLVVPDLWAPVFVEKGEELGHITIRPRDLSATVMQVRSGLPKLPKQ